MSAELSAEQAQAEPGPMNAEVDRLYAEVEHWKAHAEEAGRGFTQVCKDYARVAAQNVVLVRALEAAGVPVPPVGGDSDG